MVRTDYRPEIDGLRTIAVLSVVIYHLWPQALPGGFLGVDIFLVISGYLITRIILADLSAGQFSFHAFYLRRIKRIIPAQLLVAIVTLAVFSRLLSSAETEALGKSAFYSVFALSNVYFWLESGYFGALSQPMPLLHMWSLGVEEQFYLVWPLLLAAMAAASLRSRAAAFAVMAVLSLGAAVAVATADPSAAFYLFPFRAFEFIAGGMLCLLPARAMPVVTARIVSVSACGLLALSFWLFDENVPHPGLATLVPCLATAALLHATCHDPLMRRLFGATPMVHIGLLSYSLYLVHWPVIVAAKLSWGETLSPLHGVVALCASYVCAVALHHLWENPLRYGSLLRLGLGKAHLWLIFAAFCAANIYAAETWSRAGRQSAALSDRGMDDMASASSQGCRRNLDETADLIDGCDADILVIGDSHAAIVSGILRRFAFNVAGQEGWDRSVMSWSFPGCPPIFDVFKVYGGRNQRPQEAACAKLREKWEREIAASSAKVIVLAGRWDWLTESEDFLGDRIRSDFLVLDPDEPRSRERSREVFGQALPATVHALVAAGKKVILFEQVPMFTDASIRCAETVPAPDEDPSVCGTPLPAVRDRLAFSSGVIKGIANGNRDVFAADTFRLFCNGGYCVPRVDDKPAFRDATHLNPLGMMTVERALRWALRAFLEQHGITLASGSVSEG